MVWGSYMLFALFGACLSLLHAKSDLKKSEKLIDSDSIIRIFRHQSVESKRDKASQWERFPVLCVFAQLF